MDKHLKEQLEIDRANDVSPIDAALTHPTLTAGKRYALEQAMQDKNSRTVGYEQNWHCPSCETDNGTIKAYHPACWSEKRNFKLVIWAAIGILIAIHAVLFVAGWWVM